MKNLFVAVVSAIVTLLFLSLVGLLRFTKDKGYLCITDEYTYIVKGEIYISDSAICGRFNDGTYSCFKESICEIIK